MYFWKVNALVEDLKNQRVSQRQKMYYYLADTVLAFIAIYTGSLVASKPNVLTAIEFLLGLSITVTGVLLCYEANRQGDDAEFIDRMVCLSWPIMVRLIVIMPIIYFTYALLFLGENVPEETGIADVLFVSFFTVYYYKWLHSCILKVSK